MPFWYAGQLVSTSFNFESQLNDLKALGDHDVYPHSCLNSVSDLPARGGFRECFES
ncbi:hypothetical protein ADIARSV_1928 [Arcticibacter svalbardensis MN12-7]|uniref:Uncharacterized protein n=1 Tax=Arcticibacter svalbardensis MN12-7 TaxID=1150600 RepID=R9H0X9_9SPHI|nr:hypothetical protein ADIARSV_1928 [Arcticibacter svalbardensis MN12-7]